MPIGIAKLAGVGSSALPMAAILPQDAVSSTVWYSKDGQNFTSSTIAISSKWQALRNNCSMQNNTRVGNTCFFKTHSSGNTIIWKTNDFVNFTYNSTTISNMQMADSVIWYDSVGGRLCIAGIDGTSGNTIRIYTSTDEGATWTYQTAISTGTSTRFWKAAEGTDHVGFSYDSASGDFVKFIHKNTFSVITSSSSTYASDGAFRFIKDVGAGGAGYGRFISSHTGGMAYWDESSSGVTSRNNVSQPSTSGSYTFIDICYVGGKYVNMYKDSSGNDLLKIAYTSSLTATPTWTSAYSKTGYIDTTQWELFSNMVTHENGVTAFVSEGDTGSYYHLLFSSDGTSFSEISNPAGLDVNNAMLVAN